MDSGLEIISSIFELLLEAVIFFIELLFYLVEAVICGVVWLFKYSKPVAGMPRRKKLPERTRFFIRSCMHTTLALGIMFLVIYVGFLRKPMKASQVPSPPPPTKVDKALKVFEKAKQIKERLLPPKTEP
jgi:hypothetical protein